MKKLLLVAMMAFGIAVNAQETELNIGGTIGLPVGDADSAEMTGAIEANYLFRVSPDFKIGPTVSYIHFKGDGADAAFLPVGVASRFDITEKISLGVDLGYGKRVRPTGDSHDGFYYRPMVGYKLSDKITMHFDYSAVVLETATPATVGVGGTYTFKL